ncbi:malonate--CoA ligase [Roseovarius ramblicola]|uniref:Malonyl-CoA synthase n=1 Tax=Roseovarius ramblicola TaxID=2022336 RepID=A0ABV5I0S9_9RHOB
MANPLYDTLFARHAGRDAAFLHLVDGRTLSHDAFLRMAARLAHALRGAGLGPGDRLAAQVPKSAEALVVYAACVQAGIVFLPLNTAYTPDEVSYFVTDSGAGLLLCDPAQADSLRPVAKAAGAVLMTLDAEGGGSLPDAARGLPESFETTPRGGDDLAALLYTSGTTGRSKGAMLTQENLLSNARVLAEYWRFTARDVLLHALPIFHTHGLFVATNTVLMAGGAMILQPRFDIDAVIAALPRATAMMGVPTFYTRLLDDPRLTRDLVAHMRLFTSGSAPLLAETHAAFEARTGHRILERYGMTETNMTTSNPYEGARRAGTVGFPLPGVELRITDPESGAEVAQGAVGMLEVRGPNVFRGYWNMPEKTAEEMRGDGFFITGDLGRVDARGYVTIVGRIKDVVISGGYNIYPREVEMVLDDQPGVLESAVVGVPHPDMGEVPVAILVPEAGATPDTQAIATATERALARFKRPRRIILVDALPRNTMGKVQKNALRAEYAGIFTAE